MYSGMAKYLYILTLFLLSFTSTECAAQSYTIGSDTTIYYWNNWDSREISTDDMSGVIVVSELNSSVSTYVYQFGYIDWSIDKRDKGEYHLSRKEGDKCFMKVIANKIYLHYMFAYKGQVIEDHILLTFRMVVHDKSLLYSKR